jgi:hypothetical protein
VGRAFAELNLVAEKATNSIQECFKYGQQNRTKVLDILAPFAADIVKHIARWIKKCRFQLFYDFIQIAEGLNIARPPFLLLSRHPVLCGLMTYRLNLLMQEFGRYLNHGTGSLMAVAHLYNASKQRNLCQVWPDMEKMTSVYGAATVFIGGLLTTPGDFLKRWRLVLSVAVEQLPQIKGPPVLRH